jgi:large subunit ribosomal protein L14
MIQKQTILKSADNSGIRFAKCIEIYASNGIINSLILVSIKNLKYTQKIKKGQLFKAIIVRSNYRLQRKTGNFMLFDQNSIILLDKKNEIYSTRIFGPISNELRKKNFLKLLSLSSIII